jgi:hypothetical protein
MHKLPCRWRKPAEKEVPLVIYSNTTSSYLDAPLASLGKPVKSLSLRLGCIDKEEHLWLK